jgi:tellurite resistance protein TerB
MSFANVKDWLNQQKTLAQESITRFKNKDFLDAVVAGCALVAAADGHIDAKEKETMAGFIQRNDDLKVFDMTTVIETFNKFASSFEFNAMIGKGEALRAVHKIRANEEAAKLLIRVCCAVGMTGGDLDDNERAVIREICFELRLNPNDSGLGNLETRKNGDSVSEVQKSDERIDISRFKNKDFLEAVIAGCTLIAMADGAVTPPEKEALAHALKTYPSLKIFEVAQVMNSFDKFLANFEFSPNIGRTDAFQAVQKIKAEPDAARLLIQLCCAIGTADGDFNPQEKEMVREICFKTGLDPKEFKL